MSEKELDSSVNEYEEEYGKTVENIPPKRT